MQQLDSYFQTAVNRGYNLQGKPYVVAEWNYNNLFNVAVTNPPDDQNWIKNKVMFPPSSVASGHRPNAGILYAFTGESYTSGTLIGMDAARYYTTNDTNIYKYWICPTPSHLEMAGGENAGGTPAVIDYAVDRGTLELDYGTFLNMNKVSVTFNSGVTPVDWSVYVFEQVSNTWIEIVKPVINMVTGKCELWFNGTSWVQTQQLSETVFQRISKIRVSVRTVDRPQRRLQIVEIAGKREIDMTSRVESYHLSSSMDHQTYLHPVGTMAADDGKIVFSNSDLKMNPADPASDFFGALEGWCQYRIYVDYDLSKWGGASHYFMRVATMYANDWQQTNEYEYEVELFDKLKIIQTMDCPAMLIENKSIARIISTILDMAGIDTYQFEFKDYDSTNIVKYFWTDGTQKIFDALDSLCTSHQAALFVDEFGMFRLLTRNDIAPVATETPVWTFRGEQVGTDLPDIISLKKKYHLMLNKVIIKYNKREANVDDADISQQPLTSIVWEHSDTVVLRAAPLARSMSQLHTDLEDRNDIWVPAAVAPTWPYKGKVNIDGEVIEYDGKGYTWFNYSSGSPVINGSIVKTDEERKALDTISYRSHAIGATGGVSADATQQNRFDGRLVPTINRDQSLRSAHSIRQTPNWYTMEFWTEQSKSAAHPGKYFTPGGQAYNYLDLKNWDTQPNWSVVQSRVNVSNSIATVNNTLYAKNDGSHAAVLVADVGNITHREFGTRLRHKPGTKGKAIIAFYMTNAAGYDSINAPISEAYLANRCYVVNINTTEYCDSVGRSVNEISVQVKNGDSLVNMVPNTVTANNAFNLPDPNGFTENYGKFKIDSGKWYDIDIVYKDGASRELISPGRFEGQSTVEVFLDGVSTGTWLTRDNISPTGLFALGAKDSSSVDFEYFYGTSTPVGGGKLAYLDDDLFDSYNLTLPAGTDMTYRLAIPRDSGWLGEGVVSFATVGSNATIQQLELSDYLLTSSISLVGLGGITLKAEQRLTFDLLNSIQSAASLKIKYTSTNSISVNFEYSKARNLPYDANPPPLTQGYYDLIKGGYFSPKKDNLFFGEQRTISTEYSVAGPSPSSSQFFYDDFGAIVHEVRDFDVILDTAPAKGVGVYCSNSKVIQTSYKYNPVRGKFSLVNISHRDEIVNGTEQIDSANSIDYSLSMYGYALVDKGPIQLEIKNDLSIKKHGLISEDLQADWIFNADDAKALGQWIVDHWSEAMDTIQMDTFCSTFIQIGDKVAIKYSNAQINPAWTYIVTDKTVDFDKGGLNTTVTVRRVR